MIDDAETGVVSSHAVYISFFLLWVNIMVGGVGGGGIEMAGNIPWLLSLGWSSAADSSQTGAWANSV
jgi:NADH dehydrogenase FAD-containing subunit